MLFITIGENIPATAEIAGNEEEKPNGIDVVDGGLDWLYIIHLKYFAKNQLLGYEVLWKNE